MVWEFFETVNDWSTFTAGRNCVLPAWLACNVQVPTDTVVTEVPLTVQTLVVRLVTVTDKPDVDVGADTNVNGEVENVRFVIALNVMVWFAFEITNERSIAVAAFHTESPG